MNNFNLHFIQKMIFQNNDILFFQLIDNKIIFILILEITSSLNKLLNQFYG